MNEYTIRPATADDQPTIRRMVRSEPLDPNATDWRCFLVLEVVENDKAILASIGMVKPIGEFHEIDSVTTLPRYRGKGYAGAVVRALMERAPRPLYLLAETALVSYYEPFGFQVIAPKHAPKPMRDQARYVNVIVMGAARYHIMGVREGGGGGANDGED